MPVPSAAVAERAQLHDIQDGSDLTELLADFYGRTFTDDLLGPIFVDIAKMDLAAHLPIICDFWRTVLFHTGHYRRNALEPHALLHAKANLTSAHFERWVRLWHATVDDRHAGPKADLAKLQAIRIAYSMNRRITGQESELLGQALQRRPST